MARISDQPAKNSVDSTDQFVIEDTEHAGFRVAFSILLASITQLASLTITTLFHVNGDTELGDTEINGDLEVNGDIIQNGQAYETHAEKVYTKDDIINLRDGAVSALPTGKYAGVKAKHYDPDGHDGALVFDRTGEARVGDYTETDVTVYSPDGENFFTDSEMTEAATIPAGVTPELVSGIEYKYTAADDDTEPLMTRDELVNMTGKAILVWDAVNKKAKTSNIPALANKVLISQADGTFTWGDYTAGGDVIEASSITVTGRALVIGVIIRIMFISDITGVDTTTGLVINYNTSNYNIKVPKDGTLVNFVATNLGGSPTVYKYLQKYTTLELLYDGTQFIIQNNPVVLSGNYYRIYADGTKLINEDNLSYSTEEHLTGRKWIDGKPTYEKTYNCGELPNGGNKIIQHGITNLGAVAKISGTANYNNTVFITLPLSGAHPIDVYINDARLIIYTTDNRNGYYGQITIEYTKTTD